MKSAVFFDRDGTLIEEADFLIDPDLIRATAGAFEAVRRANQAGVLAIVVTNQSGVARGYLSENQLRTINQRMQELFESEGARLDAVYYCPHHPTEGLEGYAVTCHCRKPRPGLLEEAARERGICLEQSVTIGDSLRDIEAGHRAGTAGVLVTSGYGQAQAARLQGLENPLEQPDYVASDILRAVDWALERIRE
jgi:D-glycero-D-manno-heptose 1,7-bisphosphate phosphatase